MIDENRTEEIRTNLKHTLDRIAAAAARAGRKAEDVKLIGVSKTMTVETINCAVEAGLRCLGENKVQELLEKFESIEKKVEWHFVGHLQRNKVKYILDKVELIHSLDGMPLAEEIDKRASSAGVDVKALVQVNVAGEESKYGLSFEETAPFVREAARRCEHLRIMGLMTIAPEVGDPENARTYFRQLRELSGQISGENVPGVEMRWLSMGMTNDFEVAVEEGANLVRIGRAVFGPR